MKKTARLHRCITQLTSGRLKKRLAIAACSMLLGWTHAARAGMVYSVIDVGDIQFRALNNQGQVLTSSGILQNGILTALPQPAGGTFTATAINNLGQVVGYENFSAYEYNLAIYSSGMLSAVPGVAGVDPVAINDAGQIAGMTILNRPNTTAFLYSNGVLNIIGAQFGIFSSVPGGLNANGDLAGSYTRSATGFSQAFVYRNGQFIPLAMPDSVAQSAATAINNSGTIIGDYSISPDDPSSRGPFFYDATGFHAFGPALGIRGESDYAFAINDSGVIVGTAEVPGNRIGWVYYPGLGFADLNTLIGPASGWQLQEAAAINDLNQIVGYGQHNGKSSVYLLTPVPEPGSVWLCIGAFTLLAGPMAKAAIARRSLSRIKVRHELSRPQRAARLSLNQFKVRCSKSRWCSGCRTA